MPWFDQLRHDDVVLDALPEGVLATVEIRDRALSGLSDGGGAGLEFLFSDLQRWLPGQTLRVAFLDGNSDLHADIALATREITDACNLTFDFGQDNAGNYRRWTEADTEHAAEIRVSFDKQGYFSLVGTDSIDESIGPPSERVGGRPYQTSLNLGGFAAHRPVGWRGTVRHEFLHAIGFHHAHQNMRGPCEAAFRWEDDAGYQPTQDERGAFVPDRNGRLPGIYTYLAGYPNFWAKSKVDRNLRTEEDSKLVAGPFDRESVMLYRFADLFYKVLPSECAPAGNGQALSEGDKRGLRLLYPGGPAEARALVDRQRRTHRALEAALPAGGGGLESAGAGGRSLLRGAADLLARKLRAVG